MVLILFDMSWILEDLSLPPLVDDPLDRAYCHLLSRHWGYRAEDASRWTFHLFILADDDVGGQRRDTGFQVLGNGE